MVLPIVTATLVQHHSAHSVLVPSSLSLVQPIFLLDRRGGFYDQWQCHFHFGAFAFFAGDGHAILFSIKKGNAVVYILDADASEQLALAFRIGQSVLCRMPVQIHTVSVIGHLTD